jgi:hypothetical protein
MPRFPGNTCRTENREILQHGAFASAPGEDFNVAANRTHRDAIHSKVNDVEEASVPYVDKLYK